MKGGNGMKILATALAAMAVVGVGRGQEAKKSWADHLTLKGDVRYRYQSSDEEGKAGQPREQHRFRARLSLDAKIADDLRAGIRLVTNNGNPISDNLTMTNAFDDKEFRIDRAFIDWKAADGLNILAGKMAQPWISVSDLIFSADMNPEGAAAKLTLDIAEGAKLIGTAGYWQVQERSEDDDTTLASGQIAVRLEPAEKTHALFGASVYAYDGIKGQRLLYDPKKSFGNTTRKVGEGEDEYLIYATDFLVVEGFVQVGLDVGGLPAVIGGQYAVNTEADRDDQAFLGEIRLGDAKEPQTWEIGYQYRELEKDSVLGVFAENTDTGNGTNVKAHIPYIRYAVTKSFDIRLQYAAAKKGLTGGTDLDTFKADFMVRF